MPGQRVILTYKDYEALPADGRRYELHEGELSVTPAPSPHHQRTLANLNDIVRRHVKARGLGEVFFAPIDCILGETTIVQPDLVYLDVTRSSLVSARGIEGPPTLVVEILSPSTTLIDRGIKFQLYSRYEVPHYWVVDPEGHRNEVGVGDNDLVAQPLQVLGRPKPPPIRADARERLPARVPPAPALDCVGVPGCAGRGGTGKGCEHRPRGRS